MTMPHDELVNQAVALLVRLRDTRCEPDDAWAEVLQLRAAHPGRYIQLVWERERYAAKVHYDLLIGRGEGSQSRLCVAYAAYRQAPDRHEPDRPGCAWGKRSTRRS
jgi:hypothetical protein